MVESRVKTGLGNMSPNSLLVCLNSSISCLIMEISLKRISNVFANNVFCIPFTKGLFNQRRALTSIGGMKDSLYFDATGCFLDIYVLRLKFL